MSRPQRLTVYTVVLSLYFALSVMHPAMNLRPGDHVTFWIGLHVVQLVLIGGLATVPWLLVAGLTSHRATVARVLLVPFLITYSTLDAVLGLAWGVVAKEAGRLAPADQPAAARLVDRLLTPSVAGYVLYVGAGLCWFAVIAAVAAALERTTPRTPRALLLLGAALFGAGHAPPIGPLGIALMLAAVLWIEHTPKRDDERGVHGDEQQRLRPASSQRADTGLPHHSSNNRSGG